MENFVTETPVELFRDVLARAFTDRGVNVNEVNNLLVLDYISHVLGKFVDKDRVFIPNQMHRRLDTVTDMWIRASEAEGENAPAQRRYASREMGDFTLFACGMFPEMVNDVRFYVRAGRQCYAVLYNMTRTDRPFPLYQDLSREFDEYRQTVNHARNKYMHMAPAPNGSLRVFSDRSLSSTIQ